MTKENFIKAEQLKFKIERVYTLIQILDSEKSIVSFYNKSYNLKFNIIDLDAISDDVIVYQLQSDILQSLKTFCEKQLKILELEFQNL